MERETETASLLIAGLSDAQRRSSARSALEAIQGVSSVEMHPQRALAIVVFDPTRVVPRQMRLALSAVGCALRGIWLPTDPADQAAATSSLVVSGLVVGVASEPYRDDAALGTYLG